MSKRMKIRIKDTNHSRLVQETAFKMGYSWADYTTFVKNKWAPYLTLGHDPYRIKYLERGEEDAFYSYDAPEVELIQTYVFQPVGEQETVELNGKKYLKKDLENFLKQVSPIE